jgi:hypothetical protein
LERFLYIAYYIIGSVNSNGGKMKKRLVHAIILMMIFLPGVSRADVLIKSRTAMDQLLGIGSSESVTSVYVKGDKNRTDTKTTFNSPIFQMGDEEMNSERTEIFRLDKEVRWDLDPKDKSYREIYLRSMKPGPSSGYDDGSAPPSSPGDDIGDYIWTVKIDISDSPETINGFKSVKAAMKAVGVNREDQSDSMFVEFNVWKCHNPQYFDEIEKYQDRFSEVAGFEEDLGLGASGDYTAGFGPEFEKEAKKIEEVKGYPVKTILLIQKSTGGAGSEDQTGISDLMKGLLGGNKESEGGGGSAAPRITVLSLTNEVISVDNSAIDNRMFELPEGYIKK